VPTRAVLWAPLPDFPKMATGLTAAPTMKRQRWRKEFDLSNLRVNELARLVEARGGIASDAVLLAVAQSLLWVRSINFNRTDLLPRRLSDWARKNAPTVSKTRVMEAVEQASDHPYPQGADRLAGSIGLGYAERQRLKIKSIGADDATKQQRKEFAKERKRICDRIRRERQRREAGALPREEFLARSATRNQPWRDDGVSRRTWYRRRNKLLGTGASLLGTGASPTPERSSGTGPSQDKSYLTARRRTGAAGNVPLVAHAGETGNSPAEIGKNKPPALAGDASGLGHAKQIPQLHVTGATPNRDRRPTATERLEQLGQLSLLGPTRDSSFGQPDRAARIDGLRAVASVPPRAAEDSKLSPGSFQQMAKLQRWGIGPDRVALWRAHISVRVMEEIFAGARRRGRGPRDERDWVEAQVECALRDPRYAVPTTRKRRRGQGALAAAIIGGFLKSRAPTLTVAGIEALLDQPATPDQLGPELRILAEEGVLVRIGRGRYRLATAKAAAQ
jgi:hypothetical protein